MKNRNSLINSLCFVNKVQSCFAGCRGSRQNKSHSSSSSAPISNANNNNCNLSIKFKLQTKAIVGESPSYEFFVNTF
jgi:hypothetical protein